MGYPDAAWEREMTVQEVLLKALGGEIHWFRAAAILGWSPRTVRRWRERYEAHGYAGLVDKRLPTGGTAPGQRTNGAFAATRVGACRVSVRADDRHAGCALVETRLPAVLVDNLTTGYHWL